MKYALWLYSIPGISGVKCRRLFEQGVTAKQLYGMTDREISGLEGIKSPDAEKLCLAKKNLDPQWLFMQLQEKGISFVSLEQEEYPERLRRIPDPPYGIYYKGILPGEQRAIAVVGSRARSEYGRQVARIIGCELANCGIHVVSGLARGIDSDSHKGALDAGGQTTAVLGCGVDICYPSSNRYLFDQILEKGGCVLSEYHPGQPPLARLFPARNRIISGLCEGVVVVEARCKSGSLITADYAMEQGRDVWAVPGRVTDALSGGCNQLIAQGAGILLDPKKFAREITDFQENFTCQMDFHKFLLEKDEQLVYSLLDFCPKGIGLLTEQSGMPPEHLFEVLRGLTERDFACESIPGHYVRHI